MILARALLILSAGCARLCAMGVMPNYDVFKTVATGARSESAGQYLLVGDNGVEAIRDNPACLLDDNDFLVSFGTKQNSANNIGIHSFACAIQNGSRTALGLHFSHITAGKINFTDDGTAGREGTYAASLWTIAGARASRWGLVSGLGFTTVLSSGFKDIQNEGFSLDAGFHLPIRRFRIGLTIANILVQESLQYWSVADAGRNIKLGFAYLPPLATKTLLALKIIPYGNRVILSFDHNLPYQRSALRGGVAYILGDRFNYFGGIGIGYGTQAGGQDLVIDFEYAASWTALELHHVLQITAGVEYRSQEGGRQ